MNDKQLNAIRPRIADILWTLSHEGPADKRGLDVALNAIFCAFNEGPIAELEERVLAAERELPIDDYPLTD